MKDVYGVLVVVGLSAAVIGLLYVSATFSYKFAESEIVLKWRILGGVPFLTRRIAIQDLEQVSPFTSWRELATGAELFGNLPFRGRGVVLKRRAPAWPSRRIVITPPDPRGFIAEAERRRARP